MTTATDVSVTKFQDFYRSRHLHSAVAGGVSNAIARTCVAPMERVRLQLSVDSTKYNGTLDCFRTIYSTEGIKGFWRGNTINVIRIIPQGAVAFLTKDSFQQLLGGDRPNSLHLATASMLSGMTSMTSIYPLDMVRGRITTNPGVYRGLWHGLTSIYSESGFAGLYKGLGYANIWSMAYYGMQFFTYDSLKKVYIWAYPRYIDSSVATDGEGKAKPLIGPVAGTIFGGVAGASCTTFAYPFELARRKIQVQGLKGRPVLYSGMLDCFKQVSKSEGVLGLYKGLAANMLKSPLNVAIVFGCYESFMQLFARLSGR